MVWRALAAGASVVLAAIIGVITALVTTHSSRGLWVGLGVLIVAGAALQVGITLTERRPSKDPQLTGQAHKQTAAAAHGAGSVAVGGSTHSSIQTRVQGSAASTAPTDKHDGVVASGDGSVAVGGDASGLISTEVTDSPKKRYEK